MMHICTQRFYLFANFQFSLFKIFTLKLNLSCKSLKLCLSVLSTCHIILNCLTIITPYRIHSLLFFFHRNNNFGWFQCLPQKMIFLLFSSLGVQLVNSAITFLFRTTLSEVLKVLCRVERLGIIYKQCTYC